MRPGVGWEEGYMGSMSEGEPPLGGEGSLGDEELDAHGLQPSDCPSCRLTKGTLHLSPLIPSLHTHKLGNVVAWAL